MKIKDPKLLMVKEKIDKLSLNEDDRQDLWVSYLEDPTSNLSGNIEQITFRNQIGEKITNDIVCLYSSTLKVGSVHDILDVFTDLERSVIVMLLLGLSTDQISRYKMIGSLRLNQMLCNIALHPIWEKLSAKEKTERRGEVRPDGRSDRRGRKVPASV